MQSFAEFMAESFRSNVPLVWGLASTSRAVASFTVNDTRVAVTFEQREPRGAWHVSFKVERGEGTEVAHDAFAIFNGVLQAAEEFLETREPEVLVFATKRESLAGIYQTYLRREAETIAKLGYALEGPLRVEPYTEFVLRREGKSGWER